MVVGAQTMSSGVMSAGVEGPKTAMEDGAKTLTGCVSFHELDVSTELFVKVFSCLISRATSKMFKVPCTFTSWADKQQRQREENDEEEPQFVGRTNGRTNEQARQCRFSHCSGGGKYLGVFFCACCCLRYLSWEAFLRRRRAWWRGG